MLLRETVGAISASPDDERIREPLFESVNEGCPSGNTEHWVFRSPS